jgi:hypothetical protein
MSSEATVIEAGTLMTIECPAKPDVRVLDRHADHFVVVAIDGQKLQIGPLKSGLIQGSYPCAAGHEVSYNFEVQTPQAPPQPQAPELFQPIAWPTWFLILVPALLIVILALISIVSYKTLSKRVRKAKAPPPRPELPPDLQYRSFYKDLKSRKLLFRQQGAELEQTLTKGLGLLRRSLEHRYKFEATSLTNTEFIGELKAVLIRLKRPADETRVALQNLEPLFVVVDRARYSKETLGQEQLQTIQDQLEAFKREAET